MTAGGSPGIGRQMAVGAAWMVLMRLLVRSIGLVSTIILARLLVPEDFGLVALATSIAFAVEILGQFSFDVALIRDGKAGRAHYDTAWTLAVIRGVLFGLLIAALAYPMSIVFNDARLTNIICIFAGTIALEGFQNVGVVNFRKEMQFGREFTFMVTQKLVSFSVTLTLAVLWREYWALVAGIAIGSVTATALSYVMHKYRPRFCLREWRALIGFSKWLLVNNVLHFFSSRLDVFIIGRSFGAHDLGVYNVSSEIAALPTTELAAPIQRAIYPGLAKIAGDLERLRQSYMDGISVLLMLAVPAAAGITVLADPIVRTLLGEKWLGAIPLLQILSLNGLIKLGGANATSVLLALGRPKVITKLSALHIALLGPALVIGIWLGGLIGAAWAAVTVACAGLVVSYGITLRILAVSPLRLLGAVWRTWLAAIVMGAALHSLSAWAEDAIGFPAVRLVCGIAAGALIYAAVHFLLWWIAGRPRGAESMALDAVAHLGRSTPIISYLAGRT